MRKLLPVLLGFVLLWGLSLPAEAGVKIKAGSPSSALAPNIVLAWAYNPADDTSHAMVTANLAGIKIGSFPCFWGGVGFAGAGLDGAFGDFTFAASVPIMTCFVKNIVIQGGWEKPIAAQQITAPPAGGVRAVLGNHVWYFGVGGSFGANPSAKAKVWSGKPSAAMRDKNNQRLLAMQREAQNDRREK